MVLPSRPFRNLDDPQVIRRGIQQCRSIPRRSEQCPGVDEPGSSVALIRDSVRVAVKEVIDAVIDRILHHPGEVTVREGDPFAVNFGQTQWMIDSDPDQFSIVRQGLLVPVTIPKDDPRTVPHEFVDHGLGSEIAKVNQHLRAATEKCLHGSCGGVGASMRI